MIKRIAISLKKEYWHQIIDGQKPVEFRKYAPTENPEESTYQGRYDLGDGEGGLLNHIRNFGEWHRTHEEFGAEKKNPDKTNEILEFVKMLEKAA